MKKDKLFEILFEHNPLETIVVDLKGKVLKFNLAKKNSDDRLPNIGDVMYRDYANKHTINMYDELMASIKSGIKKIFPEQRYKAKILSITIMPFFMGAMITSEDITERYLAEKKLHESRERLLLALMGADLGIWDWNVKTGKVVYNNRWVEMIGYKPGELKPDVSVWESLLHPDDKDKVFKALNRHFEDEKQEYRVDFRLESKSGDWKWIQAHGMVVKRDELGKPIRMTGTHLDITEHKQSEEALQKSEKIYKLLADNSHDVITVFDMDLNITYVSPSVLRFRGFTPEEAMTQSLKRMLIAESMASVTTIFAEELELEATGTADPNRIRIIELQEICKDGSLIWAEVSMSFLRDQNQKPIGIITASRDISDRKQAEALFLNEKNFSEAIIESIPGMLYVYDDQGTHIRHNKNHEKMTGYSAEELSHMNPLSWYDDKADILRVESAISDVFTKGSGEVEAPMRIKNGKKLMMHFTGSKLVMDGKKYFVGVGTDITERKQAEAELMKIQKLESVGVLAGGIAHDFNNLLNVATGYVSMILGNNNLLKQEKKYLDEVMQALKRAGELTHQLLAFSKVGISSTKLGSVSKIIQESIILSLGESSPAKCELNLAENLWLVEMDMGQIGQVFRNLIINAEQAMPKGGIIQIWAENVELLPGNFFGLESGDFVYVTVKDSGVGIPKEYLDKIFDPFFTTKDKSGGSGLGLAIIHTIVKNHAGYIGVNSKSGEGTTFHLYFPAIRKSVAEVKVACIASESTMGLKILVMDDQEAIRNMLSKMLTRLGYEVETAEHGKMAIEKYISARDLEKPFDLVILDLTIPGGMQGDETLVNLLQINPDVKAIVSSGHTNKPIPEGFLAKMPKPYEMDDIKKIINEIFTNQEI